MKEEPKHIILSLGVGTIMIGLIILPGQMVAAHPPGPGHETWFIPAWGRDQYWQATWYPCYNRADVTNGVHFTGLTFADVSYRDLLNGDLVYDYYMKEVCIPWIRITSTQLNNGNPVIFEHDDIPQTGGTFVLKIMYNDLPNGQGGSPPPYFETNNMLNPTTCEKWYDCCYDGDGVAEFGFVYKSELHWQSGPGNSGLFRLMIAVAHHPYVDSNADGDEDAGEGYQHLLPNGKHDFITAIDFSFLLDADVYNNAANNIEIWDNNLNNWNQIHAEAGPFPSNQFNLLGQNARIINNNIPNPPFLPIYVSQMPFNDGHASAWFWCLRAHQNEYSQYPTQYISGEPLDGQDVQLWYVETFTPQGGNSPPVYQQGWAGLEYGDFVA